MQLATSAVREIPREWRDLDRLSIVVSICGCMAWAGLTAIARHRLLAVVPVGAIFTGSVRVGDHVNRWRGQAS